MASQEFLDALVGGGSVIGTCDLCGRTHFVSESSDYDDGELAGLREQAKKEPDRYVEHSDTDYIAWGYIFERSVVADCKCGKIDELEKTLWQSRRCIIEYYKARTKKIKQVLKHDEEAIAGLAESSES